MKINLITTIGILVVLASGCSVDSKMSDENAWIYDETLPVPIQFGALNTGIKTRAAISSFPNGEFDRAIGVFAWDEESDDPMEISSESIFPVLGYRRAEVFTDGSASSLKFKEQYGDTKKVYYPMSSKYNYSFYAYHTGNENIIGIFDDDGYVVDVNFELPFNDILWGKFSDDSLEYKEPELPHLEYNGNVIKGFNARFSRAAAQTGYAENYYPAINFRHVCSSFRFYAKADEMTDEQYEELKDNFTIDSVLIKDVPYSARLVVASGDSGKEGTFFPSDSLCDVSMQFKGGVSPDNTEQDDMSNPLKMGDEDRFFLPPGDYSGSRVVFCCSLSGYPCSIDFPLVYGNSSVFEAGICYSFVVSFKTLEEIHLKVTLSEWDETPVSYVDFDSL